MITLSSSRCLRRLLSLGGGGSRVLLMMPLLLLLSARASSAGTTAVNYPKDKPAFSLQVPEGWKTEEDDSRPERVLTFSSKDGKAKYQIYFLRMTAGGEIGVDEASRQLAASTLGNNQRIGDVKYMDPTDSKTATGIPVGRTGVTCKLAGEATYFLFAVIAPPEGHRYEAVLCAPYPLKDLGANVFDGILHTIKPVDQPPED